MKIEASIKKGKNEIKYLQRVGSPKFFPDKNIDFK